MPVLRSVYLIHCIEQYNFLNNDNFPKDFVTDNYILHEKLQNKIGYLYKSINSDNDKYSPVFIQINFFGMVRLLLQECNS